MNKTPRAIWPVLLAVSLGGCNDALAPELDFDSDYRDPDRDYACEAYINGTWTGLVGGDTMTVGLRYTGGICWSGDLSRNGLEGAWSWRSFDDWPLEGWFWRPRPPDLNSLAPTLPDSVDLELQVARTQVTGSVGGNPYRLSLIGSIPAEDTLRGVVFGGWVSEIGGDTIVAIDSAEVILVRVTPN